MSDTNPNPEEPEPSVVFAALSDRRRRCVLRRLLEHGDAMSVARLAAHVAAGEPGSDDQERAYIELQHAHIPKLADANFVTWDGDAVAIADAGEAVKPYLALAARYDSQREPQTERV